MVTGYVIGLGDRHSANLLLDQMHAEIVHIDLGIAFEQGRFLNTPEMVPFRLTRDIVDGMGVIGEPSYPRLFRFSFLVDGVGMEMSLALLSEAALEAGKAYLSQQGKMSISPRWLDTLIGHIFIKSMPLHR